MTNLLASLRLLLATSLVCVVGYTGLFLLLGRVLTPETAQGSLIRNAAGDIVGGRLVAQAFTSERYFHPRPSAVDYDAAGAGGSNLSPTNPAILKRNRPEGSGTVPQELLTASGSGLDPHITEAGARFQVERVAEARGLDPEELNSLITAKLRRPGGIFAFEPLINVLELNLALDQRFPKAGNGSSYISEGRKRVKIPFQKGDRN